jgi:hypothetical protein
MKKIFGIIVAVSAFMASCSSPYYPEYVPVVSLGASTSALVCENTDSSCSLNVISNVEYTATIISGDEWLSFADTESLTRTGNGNTVLVFNHRANNHVKRVARLVLAAETRRDTIKIKQKGQFEDYLDMHPEDKAQYLTLENGTRLSVPEEGGSYSLRLRTSCLDQELSFWCDRPETITDVKFENKTLSFNVTKNEDGQPRIIMIDVSYIDGWDDKRTYSFSIKQQFDPLN